MSFVLDAGGFYTPPIFNRSCSFFCVFGTRQATTPEGPLATVHQVHSARVIRVVEPGLAGEGDALITNMPNLALGIKTADCIPLLMVDFHHRAVAAVHAGWRGTAARIGPATLAAMREAYGTEAADLHVAIGPGIGPCCFEVGPEVAREFGAEPPGKSYLDLPGINRAQLENAGVRPDRLYDSGLCTKCLPGMFDSYRRDKEKAGRMLSMIRIEQ